MKENSFTVSIKNILLRRFEMRPKQRMHFMRLGYFFKKRRKETKPTQEKKKKKVKQWFCPIQIITDGALKFGNVIKMVRMKVMSVQTRSNYVVILRLKLKLKKETMIITLMKVTWMICPDCIYSN